MTKITANGVRLPQAFIDLIIEDKSKGIILVEGRENSIASLVLDFEVVNDKQADDLKSELPLKLTGAESMYRSFDLRGCVGPGLNTGCTKSITGTNASEEITKTVELADNIDSSKQVFFAHGANVNEDSSRGSSAEMFKRLFQSGSKAQFNSISWAGDEGIPVAYWNNVFNAFNTAEDLKWLIGQVPGSSKTVIAHSLGNMLMGSAIQDHGLNVAHYFMLNPAVAIEAYAGNQLDIREMRHSDWDDYYKLETSETSATTNFDNACGRRLWASEWHRLFDPSYTCKSTDINEINYAYPGSADNNNSKLTWRNKFLTVSNNSGVVQFYSSGEDVVRQATEGDPGFNQISALFNGAIDAWNLQEKSKGTKSITASLQTDIQGGWGFRVCDTYFDPNLGEEITIYCDEVTSPDEAFAMRNDLLRQTPFFYEMSTLNPASSEQINELLAYAIPALSYGAGGAVVTSFIPAQKTIDMNAYPGSGGNPDWPAERRPFEVNAANEDLYWLHSDFKDVAYRYVYELYIAMVVRGGLK